MKIDQELPPVPAFKTGKWLLGVITTTAIAGGIFGALTILFIPEGVFNFGPDNTLRGRGLKSVDERVIRLEQQVAQTQPASGGDLQVMQANIDTARNETRALQQQVSTIQQNGTEQQGRLATIVAGLTQMKTAYDNDQPLADGIATLQKAFPQGPVTDTLNELASATTTDYAPKDVLLNELQTLRQNPGQNPGQNPQPPADTAPLNDKDLTWRERAKLAMGQFVRVQPTKALQDGDTIAQIQNAISLDNFQAAEKMIATLPQTVAVQKIQTELAARNKVHELVQKTASLVSGALGQGQGSLY